MNREKALQAGSRGTASLNRENVMEAIIHFSESVKWDTGYTEGYLGRAEAFKKIQYYHLALEDAKRVIEISPKNIKGYVMKGSVEFEAEDFLESRKTYEKGLEIEKMNEELVEGLTNANRGYRRQQFAEGGIPMTGLQYGVFISLVLVTLNEFLLPTQLIEGNFMKLIFVGACGFFGRTIATFYLDLKKQHRKTLLEPPKDLSTNEIGMFGDLFDDSKKSKTNNPTPGRNEDKKK